MPYLMISFNDRLTNDIANFEQLGPVLFDWKSTLSKAKYNTKYSDTEAWANKQTQIRCQRMQHLILIYTVCHMAIFQVANGLFQILG